MIMAAIRVPETRQAPARCSDPKDAVLAGTVVATRASPLR